MQKTNNKTVKPKCVTARLVSIDRMDNGINGDIRLLLGLAFGCKKNVVVPICYRVVNRTIRGGLEPIVVGATVWILLENQPKLYFSADSTPLVLHTPQLCGNDHLSLLVTHKPERESQPTEQIDELQQVLK